MAEPFDALLAWYQSARRPMPWREARDPYASWLSEIMLQQTTYEQALPHYTRFRERFPSVEALAAADEVAVLKAWEGLGYYARARNLYSAARKIVAGGWPATAAGWQALPGVGPYTAAALSSVLNGEAVPVVDGNVARVFARYWTLEDDFRKVEARARLADRLRPQMRGEPGTFNQAMMELGALVCTPRNPSCGTCPLGKACAAAQAGVQADFPVRGLRKERPVRCAQAVVIPDGEGRVLLVRHTDERLLQGLWDLPKVTAEAPYAQVFTHFKLELEVFRAVAPASFQDPTAVPLTTAATKILQRYGLLKKS